MPPGQPDTQDEASRVEERQNPDGSTTISVQPNNSDAAEEAATAEDGAHDSDPQDEAKNGDAEDGAEETPAGGEAQEEDDYQHDEV